MKQTEIEVGDWVFAPDIYGDYRACVIRRPADTFQFKEGWRQGAVVEIRKADGTVWKREDR